MNLDKKKSYLVIAALTFIAHKSIAVPSVNFQRLLANPRAFNGQRVTVTGLADIGGSEFWLYPSVAQWRKGGGSIFVYRDLNGPLHEELNRHWVNVTGTVTANARGPLGVRVCQIALERIEGVPRPPVPDPYVHAVFRNDTRYTVDIKFPTPTGYGWTLNVSPGRVGGGAISKGKVTVLGPHDKIIAQGDVILTEGVNRYFDSAKRTYYYRIANGNVELVAPVKAKHW